jgi:hypothetical protein
MTLSPKLEQLMHELGPSGPRSLNHLEQALMNIRFTGTITTHWAGGALRQIDLGPPIRLTIAESTPRAPLDRAEASRAG